MSVEYRGIGAVGVISISGQTRQHSKKKTRGLTECGQKDQKEKDGMTELLVSLQVVR
jgi:hypothetical protein